jgi:hypothetical protein
MTEQLNFFRRILERSKKSKVYLVSVSVSVTDNDSSFVEMLVFARSRTHAMSLAKSVILESIKVEVLDSKKVLSK